MILAAGVPKNIPTASCRPHGDSEVVGSCRDAATLLTHHPHKVLARLRRLHDGVRQWCRPRGDWRGGVAVGVRGMSGSAKEEDGGAEGHVVFSESTDVSEVQGRRGRPRIGYRRLMLPGICEKFPCDPALFRTREDQFCADSAEMRSVCPRRHPLRTKAPAKPRCAVHVRFQCVSSAAHTDCTLSRRVLSRTAVVLTCQYGTLDLRILMICSSIAKIALSIEISGAVQGLTEPTVVPYLDCIRVRCAC